MATLTGVTDAMSQPKLAANHVTIRYGRDDDPRAAPFTAVADVSFGVRDGSFVAIVGPSGCGKSSILNAIAGLVAPAGGQLLFNGRPITSPGRDRAMVFQSAALLPWRNLLKNVTYGAEMARIGTGRSRTEDAKHLLKLVGLAGREMSYPHQLSGGMQQRANLARALATSPELLLLDEPFSALDAYTRDLLQEELERIVVELSATALLVTHQISEAVYLSDYVIVMSGTPGRIVERVEIPRPRPRGISWRKDPLAIQLIGDITDLLRSIQTDQ